MTHTEILDAMGNLTSDAEADAMAEILAERGITDLDEIDDYTFSHELIPMAIEKARNA